ncbi:DUF4190 domain-containing protein [Streptomyces sp. NBC_00249]|uniref:DUF4190 domain-containing protein n=1 Tax=Streptomyces sp. NBC_00249 TaxID=2975690 RepID=UPI00225AA37A|nr:DUF4190 domain-containing protein [Streptomyces sp. NBC_00249]MCX5194614.1 DUF4190 domain-containing protein [Streptomyces sp. NBC_00249]
MSTPAPQQPPAGPGHQWPPPWGAPVPVRPHPPALNGFALASLLVGLLCLPPLGIVFGGVALVQIARKRERGKVLALVGLAVSVVMTGLLVFGVGRYGDEVLDGFGPSAGPETAEGELTDVSELRAGDCFNVPAGDLLAERPLLFRIGCDQVHDAEVTASSLLGQGAFPGAAPLRRTAEDACWKAQDAYAMDTWALPRYAGMYYFAPTRESWRREGDRRLLCLIGTADEEHTGSLRKDVSRLTGDQVALLGVLNAADQALGRMPYEEVDEALTEYRTWAREVDTALGAEARMLQGAKGRPDVGAAAGAQLKEIEAARKEWQKASRAARPDDFQRAWDAALAATSVRTEKALRGAYGLSTTVPEWLEGPLPGPGGGPGRGPSSESI